MEKIWLKSYPSGVPSEIDCHSKQTIIDVFEKSCELYPDRPAFYSLGVTLTYRQLSKLSKQFAAFFQQELLLQKGDRIAIMLPNLLQYPIALFAALQAGLTVVNVNPLYTAPELVHQLKDSGAETIVVLANFADTVQQALQETPLKNIIIAKISDFFPRIKSDLFDFYLRFIKRKVPHHKIQGAHHFRKILAKTKDAPMQRVDLSAQDIAFLQYTGGTTGVAKGAMLTHANIVANVEQAEVWFRSVITLGKEIMITALPMYHIFSLTANCLFMMKVGALNVLIANPRDLSRMLSEMAKFKFSAITGVNTLFNALIKSPRFRRLDFSALKLSIGGGMAVQRAVAEKWYAITGCVLLEAYGLTETSPCVCINPPDLKAYNGTVGLPVPSTMIRVLDEHYHDVPLGESGELAIKGPQVMLGYWQNVQETQKVFTPDGWLLTGDIVSVNTQGYVSILERKKDMILVSGFNVYPNEVEDVIASMEGVREVAVVGVPDKNSGEVVKAYIVKEHPALTAEDVLHYSQKSLTGYKVPKYIEFCGELPKSNVGKILRRALRMALSTEAGKIG